VSALLLCPATSTADYTISRRVNKARAKLEEYERGSSTCAISPDTLLSLVLPSLLVAAADTRVLYENSRLIALEAICTGPPPSLPPAEVSLAIQTKTLSRMSPTLREQCLGIIYQALIRTGPSRSWLAH
jgi:hypothetical protein